MHRCDLGAIICELRPLSEKLVMLLAYPIDPEVTSWESLLKAGNVIKKRIDPCPTYARIGIQDILGSDRT